MSVKSSSSSKKANSHKIFKHQVGFTSPPGDMDAAQSDFLRMSPSTVGVAGRMMHNSNYDHKLAHEWVNPLNLDNFGLLEDVALCLSNADCDVIGQVGTNWVHCNGTTPKDIRKFCDYLSNEYETPFHMAGMSLVEGLQELSIEKIAVNSGYFWPQWQAGIVRFLTEAGFDVVYSGNFVDQGFYQTQQEVNDQYWIFPYDLAHKSFEYVAEQAPTADAIVITGMPNFRDSDGNCRRPSQLTNQLEIGTGKTIVGADSALYWNIYKSLGIAPNNPASCGKLLSRLL